MQDSSPASSGTLSLPFCGVTGHGSDAGDTHMEESSERADVHGC
jgi:hypothetical protein